MIGRGRLRATLFCATLLCAGPASAEEGNVFTNLFKYGGTTVPPSQPREREVAYCPTVDVTEGGAALRTMAGSNVRTQITLGRLARECNRLEDGSVSVKVGVEARVLLGPAGAPGRFEVPVTVLIKRDDKVLASRSERASATVEPGESNGFATLVADGLIVPAGGGDEFEIEVGLGGRPKAAKAAAKPKRKKPEAAAAPDGGGDPAQ